jgi:cob(I)alamin adenosyltransferase
MGVEMFKKNLGQGDTGDTYCIIQKKYVRKSHVLIELVGTLDEAESSVGLALSLLPDDLESVRSDLLWLQNLLFRIGFTLGGEKCLTEDDVKVLEDMIKRYQEKASPRGFLLHIGHPSSSALSLARTIVRRLERVFVKALDEGYLLEHESTMLPVINRISDVLYLMELAVNVSMGVEPVYANCGSSRKQSFSQMDPQ